MATQGNSPALPVPSTGGDSPLSESPSSAPRRSTRGGRGRGKAKATPHFQANEPPPTTNDMATLLSMIQSLTNQVSALRIESKRTSLVPIPSEHASLGQAPPSARSPSITPGLRAVAFIPTLGLDSQRVESKRTSLVPDQSEHPLLVDQPFYGLLTSRNVQTLSDGIPQ